MRRAARRLVEKLPRELRDHPDARLLDGWSCGAGVTIAHLIHRRKAYETQSKDYEFSRLSVEEHWQAGRDDVRRTLRHHAWRERARPARDVAIFDLTRNGDD